MVKLFAVLQRKDGMTHEEFVDHWLNRHAPVDREHAVPGPAHRPLRAARPAPPRRALGYKRYDGVTVQWFEDMDDFVGFMSEPEYAELVHPDEQRFLDMDGLVFIVTEEPVVAIA